MQITSDFVLGEGPASELIIVGEAPGADEEREKRPFIGKTGQLLNSILKDVGINRDSLYITNVIKVRPPANQIFRLKEIGYSIADFLPMLWDEIDAIQPNCIIALGGVALRALTGQEGIEKWRGSILQSTRGYPKVVPTIHPAKLFKGDEDAYDTEGGDLGKGFWRQKVFIQFDIRRALFQSTFKEFRLPSRNLLICSNSLDLMRFLERHANYNRVAVDIETFKAIPMCVGLAFTPDEALCIPIMNVMSAENPSGIPMYDLVYIWKLLAKLLSDNNIGKLNQNMKFDHIILERHGFAINNVTDDTMFQFHALYPELPKKLAVIASIETEEPYYKDEGKEYNPKKDDVKRLYLYNAKDAAVTMECYEALNKELTEVNQLYFYRKTMAFHELYKEIELNGILVDKAERQALRKKYHNLSEENDQELEVILGYKLNINSPKQVTHTLYVEQNIPRRKGVKEETLKALLNNVVKNTTKRRILELIILGRKLKKLQSTYLLAREDADGRMRTTVNICGPETGRTSTSKIKSPNRPTPYGLAFQTLTKHGDVGADLRCMFVPDPGYVFMEVDLSQAESRVVDILAKGNLFASGVDVHKLTASWLFDKKVEDITDWQRQLGKKVRHAGERGMKKRRLSQLAEISEWRAGEILRTFHRYSPNIEGVYFADIQSALESDECTLISGYGRRRQFYERWGEEMFKEAYAQIPQADVSDHTKFAMVRIRKRIRPPDFMFLQESHDSFLAQVKIALVERAVCIVTEELSHPIDYSNCSLPRGKLHIPCDIKIGDTNWEKMETYENYKTMATSLPQYSEAARLVG